MLGEVHAAGQLSRGHPERLLEGFGQVGHHAAERPGGRAQRLNGTDSGIRRRRRTVLRARLLDLPVAAAEDGHALAGGGDAVDLELRRADHEVDVRAARVHARSVRLFDEEREAVAERDVAGGVLVEQRVVEDGAERPDPPLAVDERELAEPERAVVDRQLRAQRLDVLVRVDLAPPCRPRSGRAGRG